MKTGDGICSEVDKSTHCFICSEILDSGGKYNLILCKVDYSKSQVTELLGRLVEDDWIVFVSENDFLCHKCMVLLNQMDELETNLKNVKDQLTQILKQSYHLNKSNLDLDEISDSEDDVLKNHHLPEKQLILNQNIDIPFTKKNLEHPDSFTSKEVISDAQENEEDQGRDGQDTKTYKCSVCSISVVGFTSFVEHAKEKHALNESDISVIETFQYTAKPKPARSSHFKDEKTTKHMFKNNFKKDVNTNDTEISVLEDDLVESAKTIIDRSDNDLVFCEVCGISVFKKHHKIHVCNQPTSNYNCLSCDKCFQDELAWKNHQEVCKNVFTEHENVDNLNQNKRTNCAESKVLKNSFIIKTDDTKIESNIITEDILIENGTITSTEYCLVEENKAEPSVANFEESMKSEGNESSENTVNLLQDTKTKVSQIYKCGLCDFKDLSELLVKKHVYNHEIVLEPFKCQHCHLSFIKEDLLNLHILHSHNNTNSGHCSFCRKIFLDKNHLQMHIEKDHSNITLCLELNLQEKYDNNKHKQETNEHQEENHIFCALCEFITEDKSEILKHMVCHQTVENNFCKICCQFFSSKDFNTHLNHEPDFQSLNCNYCHELCHDTIHLKSHVKQNHQDLHNCKYCNKVYTEKSSLLKHEKTKHLVKKIDRFCNICKRSYNSDRSYNNHVEYAHRTKCKVCGKELQTWKKLQYHEKAHIKHSVTSYKCDICNKVLKTQTGLRFHKIRHTGNFPFFCEFCGQGFVSTHSLTEHIGHHTKETRYTCDVCGKGFYYYDTMYRHRILHDNPYPKTCDICKKHFRNASRVAIHKRREHTGERPYKCTYCPQSFFTSNGYKHHLCLHTKIFPYNCKQCNKGFTTRHKYAIHLSRKHSDHTLLVNRAPNNKEWNEQWLK